VPVCSKHSHKSPIRLQHTRISLPRATHVAAILIYGVTLPGPFQRDTGKFPKIARRGCNLHISTNDALCTSNRALLDHKSPFFTPGKKQRKVSGWIAAVRRSLSPYGVIPSGASCSTGIADKRSPRRIPEPRSGRVGRLLWQGRQRGVISTSADASGYRASRLRCSIARGSWSRCPVRGFQGYPSPPAPPGLEAITAQLCTSAVGTSTALRIIYSSS